MFSRELTKKFKKPSVIFVTCTTLITLTFALYQFWKWLDPAYFAAKPVEDALIKAGAVKKCSESAWGLGPDNLVPWYDARYTLSADQKEIASIATSAAINSGFEMQQIDAREPGAVELVDVDHLRLDSEGFPLSEGPSLSFTIYKDKKNFQRMGVALFQATWSRLRLW